MTQQLITISPMDDSVVAQRSYAMPDEIQAAPARAKHAQRAWQNTPLATRAALVTSAFDALGRRRMRSPHWLTLLQMVELFDRDKSVISRHLKNIFDTGELPRGGNCCKNCNSSNRRCDGQKSNMQKMHIAKADLYLTMAQGGAD